MGNIQEVEIKGKWHICHILLLNLDQVPTVSKPYLPEAQKENCEAL